MLWTKASNDSPIGLIAGYGEFPILFAKAAAALKKPVVAFGVEGVTDKKIAHLVREAHFLDLGAVGALVDLLKKLKIKKVVFAGGIPKREIYNPRFQPDEAARTLMEKTKERGDNRLLKAFEFFLKAKCGVSVVDSRVFLKEALAPAGVLTKRKPSAEEYEDLKFGFKIAKGIGRFDIGQTVAVKRGVVLAVEAIEGTDAAIRRGGAQGMGGAVIVKVSKPNQDLRYDLPTVGPETIESLKSANSSVLGVEAGKTLILSGEKLLAAADEYGLSVVGVN